jgi:hypothetical protein
MGARKADLSVPEVAVAVSGGWLQVNMETRGEWQNLSIRVSESVILTELRVANEVTIPQNATENTEVRSGRTSDFRHLGLWP